MIQILQRQLREIKRPNVLPETLNVGITGGIGSGKSTLANLLVAHGAQLIDLDAIAHQVTGIDGVAMLEIFQEFGREVVNFDGSLDRAAMRSLVFQDAAAKSTLEQITHRHIYSQAISMAHELA